MRFVDLPKCNATTSKMFDSVFHHLHKDSISIRWPTEICIESTTVCNSHCRFCTHDDVVLKRKGKPHQHLDYEKAASYLDWIKGMVDLNGIDSSEITFSGVGLGEPLLCPDFIEINNRARTLFPDCHITMNTNCHSLDEVNAKKIIDGPFNQVTLSLGYIDRDDRNRYFGVERYDDVVENIERFLRMRGDDGPSVMLHVFDVPENRKHLLDHVRKWSMLMRKKDTLQVRDYMSLVDGEFSGHRLHYPCYQIWSVMVVDILGYVYPCCIGAWHDSGNPIAIGNVNEPQQLVMQRVESMRREQLGGKFGSMCQSCAIVHQNADYGRIVASKIKKSKMV